MAGVKAVYKKVAEATKELIVALGNMNTKAIRAALAASIEPLICLA